MTTVRRLRAVSAILGLAAVATCSHVWGEPAGDKAKNTLTGRNEPPPLKRQLAEELGATKFTDRNLVLYETLGGERLFALQVQPKLEAAKDARPRDLLILVDTSASQVRGPLDTARQIADGLVAAAKADDRVAIWTVNTPAATQNLTRSFEAAHSAKVKDALKALKQEVPFGGNDLKNALDKAVASFDAREGRQRVIVYLGSGKSLLNPIANADRLQLCEKMVGKEISFFPVPLGANLEPVNLHGFTTGTGGLLVRVASDEAPAVAVEKLTKAIAAPVLYTKKFQTPVEVTECYPTKLPPLRTDSPTLVVGKLRPGANFVYTVDGELNGKHTSLRLSEPLPAPEIDNFFLIGMVEQWKVADRKEAPSPFRADRALAMSFERGRLQRDEFNAQGAWAVEEGKLDVAVQMFGQARKIDPNDQDADAGMKIVEKMKAGLLNKDKLRDALGKPGDAAILIQKQGGKIQIDRGRMDKMVAMLQPEEKMGGPNVVAPVVDPNFPPDKEPLLRLQQQRQAVEEQRITQIVNEAERQARRILPNDPEAAHDVLKRTLASIRDNADLGPQSRQNLINRLEVSLRNADLQGARIKRDLEEGLRREADARARIAATDERLRGEEQVLRRIKAFNELMNTGRVEEAHKEALVLQADTVARGGQIHPTMVAAHDMGINAIHIREQQEIKRATEERYLLAMLQVDKSHIPFPDEPPVGFPPTAVWRELTKRRQLAGYDSVGLGENQADRNKAKQIQEKLSKPVNLEKGIDENTALKDALDFLADRYDLTIIIDAKAFEAIGVAKVEEQPVKLPRMVGVSMATVLRLLLAQVKGDVYTGTYLVRRDFIEVTTTYNAAAEKVVRAYPVADLVIPIPNSVNQQALQQSLQVYGQFQQAQNPFQFGILGIGGGMGAGGGGNPFAAGQNPMNFNGGGVGNNQFGNLGGQFGLQGGNTSYELMSLIVKVVAPGEWIPLGPDPGQPGNPGGAPPGLGGGVQIDAIVPQELLNSLDYYNPAHALVVRGSSRVQARLDGGVLGPGPGAAPVMGGIGFKRDDVKLAKNDPKNPDVLQVNSKTDWEAALTKVLKDPGVHHPRMVIATADFLVDQRKFDHAAEFLKANLKLGIVTRPWVYEALGVALQLSGGSPDEIERAQVSGVDLEPQDAKGYLRAAKAMSELKRFDRAVAFCKQAAMMEPNLADSYANALVYAGEGKDGLAMAWAASQLLKQDWPADNDELHARAKAKVADLAKVLDKDQRRIDAERLVGAVQQVKQRDLVANLKWQGEADFDLKVKEPIGTVCSFLNKQTPAGGILLGDDLANLAHKSYIAAEAFNGEYEFTVERVWGRPLGAKVTLEIIRHQGTAKERIEIHTIVLDRNNTVKVTLDNGRRVSTASVPPPAAVKETEREGKLSNPDRVLNKLRAMADPSLTELTGVRASVNSTGSRAVNVPTGRPTQLSATPASQTQTSYQKIGSFVNNALDLTTQTTIIPEKGEMRIKVNPVFQSAAGRGAAMQSNPLIPGGF